MLQEHWMSIIEFSECAELVLYVHVFALGIIV